MRAPLVGLVLGTLTITGVLAACAAPSDLSDVNEPEAISAGRDAGKRETSTKDGTAADDFPPPGAPGGPASDGGPGTPQEGGAGKGTDAGNPPPPPPPPPPTTPFKRMDIRYPVLTGDYVLQCTLDAKTQLVWKTTASGTDTNARFANPAYTQPPNVYGGCGPKVNGEYPLVFTSLADGALPAGTYVVKCSSSTRGDVYRVGNAFEGHPSATFVYDEAHPACAVP